MLRFIRQKETSQIAVVTGSRRNKRGCSKQYNIEASRNFRNKKRECLKDNIIELATNGKNKDIRDLYRGINRCKRGFQPIGNLG
jgi:hypothetical protein